MTTAITQLPTPPSRERPNQIRTEADAFHAALPDLVTQANTQNAENNSLRDETQGFSQNATVQAVDASLSAGRASTSAITASTLSTAANWVSGTTYAIGNVRRSLLDGLPYERKTAGAGTTDPKLDTANWQLSFFEQEYPTPKIRPTLILDPVNSGVVDSRIVTTRSSTATYWDEFGVLRTAPANTLRIDHDPATGERLGYLVEGAATNLCTHSEAQLDASWGLTTSVLTKSMDAAGPTGPNSLCRITSSGGLATTSKVFTSSGTTLCVSWVVGPIGTGSNLFFIRNNTTATNLPVLTWNYLTGAGVYAGPSSNFSIQPLAGGCYRLSIYYDTGISSGDALTFYYGAAGGNVPAGQTWTFGFVQFETGVTRPTSYIPTDGAAVTRAADVPVISGDAFAGFYNQSEGTWVVQVRPSTVLGSTRWVVSATDSSGLNRCGTYLGADGVPGFNVVFGGVNQALITTSVISASAFSSIAASYASNDFKVSLNGGSPSNDTSGNLPTPDRLSIGRGASVGQELNGLIRRIAYYPRAVSAAQLQALSRI